MESHKLIYFRTDGNSNIASGHLMRCVSIALACQALGMETRFLVSDAESSQLLSGILKDCGQNPIHQKNFPGNPGQKESVHTCTAVKTGRASARHRDGLPVIQLGTASYGNLEQELPEVISLLRPTPPSAANCQKKQNVVFFLDSYSVTENYLAALKPYAKIAYLDDLQLFDYPVDLLVNYDVIPDSALPSYQAAYQKAGQVLLGGAYTPLRRQFLRKQDAPRETVSNILVTTGGSDPCHFCLHFALKILHAEKDSPWDRQNFPQAAFHLVAGKLNQDKEQLRQLAEEYSFLQLHENVGDMASLMESCDLAVSAAGTTLYELCALGVPAISFSIAQNQTAAAKAFDTAGAIPWAGHLPAQPEKVFRKIAAFLVSMCTPSGEFSGTTPGCLPPPGSSLLLRKAAQETMARLVDGRGASRIAQALCRLS